MRFVPIKSADQQALLMLHRTGDLLIRQRTQLINALRARLAEFGLVAATGREGLTQLAAIITDESNREALPSAMKQALQAIVDQLAALELQIGTLERAIHAHHRANDMSCRLETVPGIGVIGATAIASTVTDPNDFKSGRDFAAWTGLVPRQHSTGGKEQLGGRVISANIGMDRICPSSQWALGNCSTRCWNPRRPSELTGELSALSEQTAREWAHRTKITGNTILKQPRRAWSVASSGSVCFIYLL